MSGGAGFLPSTVSHAEFTSNKQVPTLLYLVFSILVGISRSQDSIVTTRISTFSVGNPELNLHLPLESWVEGKSSENKELTSKQLCMYIQSYIHQVSSRDLVWTHSRVFFRAENVTSIWGINFGHFEEAGIDFHHS